MAGPVAVIGAGGPVGRLCVKQLLEAGCSVRAIVRFPEKYEDAYPRDSSVVFVKGDVTDARCLHEALGTVKSIIFAAGGPTYLSARAVENKGVDNVANAAKAIEAHVILVSASLVTPKRRWHPIRILMNNVIRYNMANEKFTGEKCLRESGASYTIVRPGRFLSSSAGHAKILTGQRDNASQGSIAMADLATVCVAAVSDPQAKGITVEIKSNAKISPGPRDLDVLFDGLTPGIYDL